MKDALLDVTGKGHTKAETPFNSTVALLMGLRMRSAKTWLARLTLVASLSPLPSAANCFAVTGR